MPVRHEIDNPPMIHRAATAQISQYCDTVGRCI